MENIFFDRSKLKYCGRNVIIGKTVRIRYPELVEIGDNSILDDFLYISTSLKIGKYVHISAGCHLIGGRDSYIEMDDFSALAPNVVLAAGSGDYTNGLITACVPLETRGSVDIGKIFIGRHSVVGANSVILPNVIFGEGSAMGALSLASKSLEDWSLYAGNPARKIKDRNKEEILKLEQILVDKFLGK